MLLFIYFLTFIFVKFSNFYVKNGILEHRFLFINELKIPLNQIYSLRTDSENFSDKENSLKFQFLLPAPYVCITYSKDGKVFISRFAFTYESQKLKKYIETVLKLEE
jgi:hypothetical protein